jgi:HlyD family secretion protein
LKNRTKGIIAGIIIVILGLAVFLWPRNSASDTPVVETSSVTQQDFRDVISTVGIIEPTETESFVGQGPVAEVNVEENEEVEEGAVLATYIDGTQFIAPFSGTVVELNIEEEGIDLNANQNRPSLVLSDLNNLQVNIDLSKNEANRVEVDQPVELSYLETAYEGTVTHVDSVASSSGDGISSLQASQGTPTLNATISFDSTETDELIAGFDIDADIIINTTTDSLAIPIESILYNDEGNPYVFVVEGGIARATDIETGIQEGVMIEVVSGLEVEDEVVQLPSEDLEDGTEVTVQNDDSNE